MPPVDGTPAPEPAVAAAPAPVAVSSPATAAPTPVAAPAPGSDSVAPKESAPATGEAPKVAPSLVAAAKPAEGEKPAEAAPALVPVDVATLKLPEGFTLHDKGKEQLAGLLAKNPTVGKEFVEDLLAHHAAEVRALSDRQLEAWNSTRERWVGEVKADPDIGGRNLEPTLQSIGKAISHFGGADADSIREAFNITGAGDNPQIVRFLSRVAKALNEGGYVGGSTAKPGPKSAADTLWPPDETGQVRSTGRK